MRLRTDRLTEVNKDAWLKCESDALQLLYGTTSRKWPGPIFLSQEIYSYVRALVLTQTKNAGTGVGDLERSIARLCASSLGAFGRDNASVVLYEDAAKRKVSAFLAVLRGLEKLQAQTPTAYTPSACLG